MNSTIRICSHNCDNPPLKKCFILPYTHTRACARTHAHAHTHTHTHTVCTYITVWFDDGMYYLSTLSGCCKVLVSLRQWVIICSNSLLKQYTCENFHLMCTFLLCYTLLSLHPKTSSQSRPGTGEDHGGKECTYTMCMLLYVTCNLGHATCKQFVYWYSRL